MKHVLIVLLLSVATGVHAQSRPPSLVTSADSGSVSGYGGNPPVTRESMLRQNAENRDRARSYGERAIWAGNVAVGAADFYNDYSALDTSDLDYDPSQVDAGGPSVPSSCAGSEACNACYSQAVEDINKHRMTLGKAWALARSTIVFAEKGKALGDSMSGVHPSAGLGWNFNEKPKIDKSLTEMRAAYGRRYNQHIAGLEQALRDLGECEGRHYGQEDWFDRFGYLYLTFMKAKFENPDP